MRRTAAAAAGILALSLGFTACGSDTTTDKSADAGDVSGTLTFWDTSDPKNEAPAFKELVEKFEAKYPDVSVKYQSVPFGDAQNKFKTAADAGSGAPDVLRAEVAWVADFAAAGHLYALDGTKALDQNFLETPLSSAKYDGKTYGVPQVTDTLGLMYNKALFEKAGISEPPATWAEVAEDAKLLKQKANVGGIYLNNGGYFMLPFLYGEGGDLVDTDAQKIVVNSDANKAGLKVAQDLVKSGAAVKPAATDSYNSMMTLFKTGKVAMIINGPWEVANVSSDPKFGGFENLGVAPVPAGSQGAGAPVGGHDYVVWSGMDKSKEAAAVAFTEFMSSAESQAFLADELGLLPANADAYDLVDSERVAAWADALKVAKPRPWIPEGGLFFSPLDALTSEVLVQGKPVDAALDKAAEKFKADVVPDYTLD